MHFAAVFDEYLRVRQSSHSLLRSEVTDETLIDADEHAAIEFIGEVVTERAQRLTFHPNQRIADTISARSEFTAVRISRLSQRKSFKVNALHNRSFA